MIKEDSRGGEQSVFWESGDWIAFFNSSVDWGDIASVPSFIIVFLWMKQDIEKKNQFLEMQG